MLQVYIKEFIAICDYLTAQNYACKNNCFIIPKTELDTLLNKNRYETALYKLKIWKSLNWIKTEEKRLTKRIYSGQHNVYIPCIIICRSVYLSLKSLTS